MSELHSTQSITYKDKPWLKHYDPGVPHTLAPYPERTMQDILRKTAAEDPDRPALITSIRLPLIGHQKHIMTYGELDRHSDEMAAALVALGVRKGDRVAIIMPNSTQFVIAFYAILKVGAVTAAMNPAYPAPKLQYHLNYSGARFAFTYTAMYNTLKQVQPQTKLESIIATNLKEYMAPAARIAFGQTMERKEGHFLKNVEEGDHWFQDLLRQHANQKPEIEVFPDDLAIMQFTGGTTGVPKGALATHRTLSNSTHAMDAWTSVEFPDAPPRGDFHIVAALPMFHIFGMVVMLSQAMACGWKMLIVIDARDTNALVDLIHHYKPEVMLGVPLLFHAIANHPKVLSGDISFSSFAIAISAASALHPNIKQAVEKAGCRRLAQGYGLSEVPCGNHCNPFTTLDKGETVGIALPDVDGRIVDLETGTREMPVGAIGEIILHTPFLMVGYHNMPEETANALREFDGKLFMYTGDIGKMDEDGYFTIVDRKKDMALIGGFNVYPGQVEKALKDHPAVEDAGVWYIPHPKVIGEEALKAWVVLKHGYSIKTSDLVTHCKQLLAAYEVPRTYAFVDKLPYSAAGKLLRRELLQLDQSNNSR